MLEGGIWLGHRRLRLIFGLMTLAVMAMIFFFSAQPGAESAMLSGGITQWLARFIDDGFDLQPPEVRAAVILFLDHVTRKLGHFCEFALLAFCLRLWWETLTNRHASLLAWGGAPLVAATGEIHQRFVDARGAAGKDVLIDSAGALTGALAAYVLIVLIARSRARKEASLSCP